MKICRCQVQMLAAVAFLCTGVLTAAFPDATVTQNGTDYILSNSYVQVVFSGASINSLKGDFQGKGQYGEELMAGLGFSLQSKTVNGPTLSSSDNVSAVSVQIVSAGPKVAAIAVSGLQAGAATESWYISLGAGSRGFQLNTTGSLDYDSVNAREAIILHSLYATPLSIYGFYPADGVVQMMNAVPPKTFMTSARSLERVYMIGGVNPDHAKMNKRAAKFLKRHPTRLKGKLLESQRKKRQQAKQQLNSSPATQGAIDIVRVANDNTITMLGSGIGILKEAGLLSQAKTGFVEVVSGGNFSTKILDSWSNPFTGGAPDDSCHFRQTGQCSGSGPRQPSGDRACNEVVPCHPGECPSGYCECKGGVKKHPVTCKLGSHQAFTCADICSKHHRGIGVDASTWATSMLISPNNRNFPASTLTTTQPNLPDDDLAAIMTGIYGSSPGCLCTFPNAPACPKLEGKHEKVGQIATTVARPSRGYGGTYNYFDPDNFFSMTALIYSGDKFLQEQARTVIERSGTFLCIGQVQKTHKCAYGQLPHHFVGDQPTFLALSGATQTGPNTFWVKSALQYARNSGNVSWLQGYMPTLRAAAAFCFDLINNDTHLLLAPGSLMIDVFIRQNYTSDSNAMMVGFLREFANAEDAVGNHTGAATLRTKATAMADAVNKYMWDGTDHYVTQVNPDDMQCAQTHSCRDFVDYDSNLIAVAHSIPHIAQAKAVLHRIDTGIQRCTAMQGGGPQWTSEIWYGKHDTTHGNIGDSSSAMGRIAWFDGKARKVTGDVKAFDVQMDLMQKDLLHYTWMHERYGCDGKQQTNRTAAYFEYPSTVAILLREIRYGIELSFGHVSVSPMPARAFHYHIGDVDIDYQPHGTSTLHVPPSGSGGQAREFRLSGMRPNGNYRVHASRECAAAVAMTSTGGMDSTLESDDEGVLRFRTFAHCGVSITLV